MLAVSSVRDFEVGLVEGQRPDVQRQYILVPTTNISWPPDPTPAPPNNRLEVVRDVVVLGDATHPPTLHLGYHSSGVVIRTTGRLSLQHVVLDGLSFVTPPAGQPASQFQHLACPLWVYDVDRNGPPSALLESVGLVLPQQEWDYYAAAAMGRAHFLLQPFDGGCPGGGCGAGGWRGGSCA